MSIWREYLALQKARREKERVVMADYDRDVHYPALKALRERCVAEGGHHWQWTHVGPSGDPWYSCRSCGKTECRHDDAALAKWKPNDAA